MNLYKFFQFLYVVTTYVVIHSIVYSGMRWQVRAYSEAY